MSKTLDLTKVSENLTPKERAKLVITFRNKEIEDIPVNLPIEEVRKRLPTLPDIVKIVHACPPEQVKEYNSYIELEHRVRNKVLLGIEYSLQYFDALEGRIAPLRYAFGISPLTYHALEAVKRLPRLVTKEEYEKGLEKAREIRREEVSEMGGEGNANLAEWEAYYRLIKEGKIKEEGTNDLTDWLDYIGDYGKTKEELIDQAVKGAKHGLEEYRKHKERTGKDDPIWKDYKKYEGLTDKKLKETVAKGIGDPTTTKEDYELWHKTVKEERERILQAVKDRKLKWVKRKEKRFDRETKSWKWEEVEGVEEGSYYDWKERHQKYAGEEGGEKGYNPFSEDCIELRYIEGKGVVYVGDPSLTEEEEEKEEFIAIKVWDTLSIPKEVITSFLEALLPVRVDKDRKKWLKDEDTAKLRLSTPQVEEALIGFVAKIQEEIKDIQNKIALVKAVEEKHFDGMEIASRDPKNPTGTIARALKAIENLTQTHNSHLRLIEETFNKLGRGLWEYKLEHLDDFLINPNQEADKEWVEEELGQLEEEAGIE